MRVESLSKEQISSLGQCKGEELARFLSQLLSLDDYRVHASNSILLDFYLGNLSFASESGFDDTKTAVVFSILKDVYEKSLADNLLLEDSFLYFKNAILFHYNLANPIANNNTGSDCGQMNESVLTLDDVEMITNYFSSTFYQHYKLFSFVFTNAQDNFEIDKRVCVQICLIPTPPLSQALSEQEWLRRVEQNRITDEIRSIDMLTVSETHHDLDLGEKDKEANFYGMAPNTQARQASTAYKILETVYQTANSQIKHLRDTLQKQFSDKEEQITELIARVESNL